MRIEAGPARSKVVESTEDEYAWLKDFLTFETVSFIRGKPRVLTNTYLGFRGVFPVGLTPMVERHAAKSGLELEVEDVREPAPPLDPAADLSWLRDYQLEVVERCLDRTRGVVSSPTGSGKGEMIVAITWKVQCDWLVLVHRDNLAEDLGKRFERRTGEVAGWIRKGDLSLERVTFGTFQQLFRRLSDPDVQAHLQACRGLIVDEAHTSAADTFNACTQQLRNTFYRFGFSGTPFDRTDSRSIAVVSAVGPRIYSIPATMLIERGYIPRPIIQMIPCWQAGKGHRKYATAYKHIIEKSKLRNDLCLRIMETMGKPGIAFVRKRDHGLELAKLASGAGLTALYVDGKSSKEQREEVIKAVRRGDVDVLISTVVFQEGLDVPSLRSVANLAAGASVIEILQRLGRGMRKESADDDTFEVWDVYDAGQEWFQKHSRKRAVAMAKQGHDVWIGELGADPEELDLFDLDARVDWVKEAV
jgi:superfamily II DNA or RNA helicase